MGFTDGVSFAIALASISALVLLTRGQPRVIGWFGVLVALAFFVGGPIDLIVEGTPSGVTGPISTVLTLLWIFAAGLLLLIKLVWDVSSEAVPMAASPVVSPA